MHPGDEQTGAEPSAADAELLRRLQAVLRAERREVHAVELSVEQGVVILDGEASAVAVKKRTLERTAAAPGVVGIVDRLRVAPTQSATDTDMRDQLCRRLADEPELRDCTIVVGCGAVPSRERTRTLRVGEPEPRGQIEVLIDDGVVTLDGEVASLAHKRLAGVLAWWVPGTRDVVNGLAVEPPEEDSDDRITEGVRLALEKDPFVEAGEVAVSTSRRTVTLGGVARSELQRRMAETDAWCVFGVDEVENRLVVREPAPGPRGG